MQYCNTIGTSEMTYTVSSGTLNPTIPYHATKYCYCYCITFCQYCKQPWIYV